MGNAGNAADTTGYGAVDHVYAIGKYEVTAGQYTAFLNAVAATDDPYGLYNTSMCVGTTYGSQRSSERVRRAATRYSVATRTGRNRPVNYVSFWDAARFVQLAAQRSGHRRHRERRVLSTSATRARSRAQADAKYLIPTENEWYKAAYHKNDGVTGNYFDYPTGSDSRAEQRSDQPGPGQQRELLRRAATRSAVRTTRPRWASSRTRTAPTARSIRAAISGNGTRR